MDTFATATLDRLNIVLTIAVLVFLWCLETWLPLYHGRHGNRLKHAGRNIVIALFNTMVIALMFSWIMAMVAIWNYNHKLGLLHILNFSLPIETGIALLVIDGWMYLWHRANHEIPFLWRFHRMHHSDCEVDVTSATRFHIGELILSSVLRLMVLPLLGLELWQLILYEVILLPVIQFHHSNVNLPERWDRLMRAIIVSPNMHRVHHSRIQLETDSNYSSVLSFWDRLARTFRLRDDVLAIEFGLLEFDDLKWQTILGMLRTPFRGRGK